jgi:hypothetical protein
MLDVSRHYIGGKCERWSPPGYRRGGIICRCNHAGSAKAPDGCPPGEAIMRRGAGTTVFGCLYCSASFSGALPFRFGWY